MVHKRSGSTQQKNTREPGCGLRMGSGWPLRDGDDATTSVLCWAGRETLRRSQTARRGGWRNAARPSPSPSPSLSPSPGGEHPTTVNGSSAEGRPTARRGWGHAAACRASSTGTVLAGTDSDASEKDATAAATTNSTTTGRGVPVGSRQGGVSREGPRTCHASGRSLYLTGRSLRRPKLPPFNLPTFAPPSVHVRSRTLRSLHTASQNTRPASCHRRHVLFSFPCAGDCQGPVERAGRVRVSRSHPQPMTAVCCAARAVLQRCNKHLVPLTLTRPLST